MKSIDIRAETAVKLIAEFLDMDDTYVEGERHPTVVSRMNQMGRMMVGLIYFNNEYMRALETSVARAADCTIGKGKNGMIFLM